MTASVIVSFISIGTAAGVTTAPAVESLAIEEALKHRKEGPMLPDAVKRHDLRPFAVIFDDLLEKSVAAFAPNRNIVKWLK